MPLHPERNEPLPPVLRFFAVLSAAAVIAACPFTNLPPGPTGVEGPNNDYIFNLSEVTGIVITVTADEWNKFLAYYDANGKHESLVRARVDISKGTKTKTFEEVGLGLRGNLSRQRPEGTNPGDEPTAYWYGGGSASVPHDPDDPAWRHAHFKIDFNAYVPGQEYEGIDKLNLKWFKDDPTRTKEVYSYDLFRRFGVTSAPRVSYAGLTLRILEADGSVIEAPFGAYMMLEAIDNDFLRAREVDSTFDTADGYLFKCLYPAPLTQDPDLDSRIGVESVLIGGAGSQTDPFTLQENLTYPYDLKAPKEELPAATAALLSFIDKLNNLGDAAFASWIPTVMDIDTFLKTTAVTVAVGMWDDYWYNHQNYYLYLEKSGRVTMIPYDYDNTLGTGMPWTDPPFDPGTQNPLDWGDVANRGVSRPLVTRILAIPAYLEKYKGYLAELIDPAKDLFDPDKSIARCLAWRSLIEATALADTTVGDDPASTWNNDAPPGWGFVRDYRVLSGGENDSPTPNFFRVRKAAITYYALGGPPLAGPDLSVAPTVISSVWEEYIPGGKSLMLKARLSAVGDVAAVALLSDSYPPSPAQILAGTNGNDVPAAAHRVGGQVIEGNNHNLWITGLSTGTTYYCYFTTVSPDGTKAGDAVTVLSPKTTAPVDYKPPTDDGTNLTFQFWFWGDSTRAVYLNGGFNHWGLSGDWQTFLWEAQWALTYNVGSGLYELVLPKASFPEVSSGQEYKFTIRNPNGDNDNEAWWFNDPVNQLTRANDLGNGNSVMP